MNRRTFLTLAVSSSLLGLAGCGSPSSTGQPAAQSSASSSIAGSSSEAPAPPLPSQKSETTAAPLPDRLEIPAIEVDIPVVELGWHPAKSSDGQIFSEWDVAEYAAGWHKNSKLPGEGGNVVLSGHNNILGAVFRELDQLKQDDEVIIWMNEREYTYLVDQVIIVPEKNVPAERRIDNARWIGDFADNRLTLVSCWPRNNNTHRIIVIAKLDEAQAA